MIKKFGFKSLAMAFAIACFLWATAFAGEAQAIDDEKAQQELVTPIPTETPLQPTETMTPTVAVTSTSAPSGRPIILVDSYNVGSYSVHPGQDFELQIRLRNDGQSKARSIKVAVGGGDFIPRGNGGVFLAGVIAPGASTSYRQPLAASATLGEDSFGILSLQVTYSDDAGAAYSESFSLGIPIGSKPKKNTAGTGFIPTPTATPTPAARPQLIIRGYHIDLSELKPGSVFTLSLDILNAGGSEAKRITMIMGGGSSTGDSGTGTKSPESDSGGLSGAGGDFSNFAPIGTSNVHFLGNLAHGDSLIAAQKLIVNSGTKPGAYPVRFSFTYSDEKGGSLTDDQVITLLVILPPMLDISFYRPPDPLFAGLPASLPIQIINLDRNSLILSRMEVSAEGATLENSTSFIGYLDPGGYFTLDPMVIPELAGPLTVAVSVEYMDDFSQLKEITVLFEFEVMEAPVLEPDPGGPPGMDVPPPTSQEETFWQKALRFARGFFGLDSGRAEIGGESGPPPGGYQPPDGSPIVIPGPAG